MITNIPILVHCRIFITIINIRYTTRVLKENKKDLIFVLDGWRYDRLFVESYWLLLGIQEENIMTIEDLFVKFMYQRIGPFKVEDILLNC